MNYLRIRKGKFAEKAEETTQGAVRRSWNDRDTGEAMQAYDIINDHLSGMVVSAAPVDGKFGQVFEVVLKEVTLYKFVKKGEFIETKEEEVMITIPMTDRNNFGHLVEKLMSADLKKEMKISPYWIKGTSGEKNREGEYYPTVGLNIFQGEDKLQSKYWENKERGNGYPQHEKGWSSNQWKMYRLKEEEFLVGEIAKLELAPVGKEEKATEDDLVF